MRILIVEDYAPLRDSLNRALSNDGYAVDATGDGEEGLWFLKHNDFDLAILDLMLPQKDGYTIIQEIRQQNIETAILVLSARDTVEDQIKGLDLGADDYMCKPFALDELKARVRSLLRRRHAQRSPLIKWNNLELNTNTKQVHVNQELVDLSAREYALLEYLMLQHGSLVTRNDLWEHLYDFNADVTSNVIDQWVARIRRKVTAKQCPNPIETIRGQGYRFRHKDVQ